ncbi:hypothetical protein TGPRC2_320580 [Toxoplasma gondii TgCatPRC2]|uniref:Transmembrane protein n=4 Tax=Toxoplasma gondii TaxID=5811 RepID=S7UIY0_TOXGG|nr:hypothetical protein TGME49_320580 [Toxoplasma gondii ME49]EPR58056.1 hypothetical protein TGGT1_320580 [Toxoplasma gondii GT1]EPT31596.1 hypothetical protein TGME49_320580 [Toxoplasma gondii ME49]KAF4644849.1 hypothetical protein TGRH88_006620 [Toxoplasma gondii]KYK66754.1 hypothetical protein TGPRC2_320580 [Toxoplasma gondii TgCatPRC2]|eukprot:XP_002369915.1 hypothetical protein TGME49_320580 [Toxoplasma gondii ME49]
MKVQTASACLLLVAVPSCSAAVLRSQEKGFFDVLAQTALQAAGGALQGVHETVAQALGVEVVPPEAEMPTPAQPSLNLPELDEAQARKIDTMQKMLERKLQHADELRHKLLADVQYMKDKGLLEKPSGAAALQAALPTASGAAAVLEQFEAPIIFLEPPPVSPKQQLDAATSAEAALHMSGDEVSPVMKRVKEYERMKLGMVSANTLDEVRREIKQVQADIKKRNIEREELYKKIKKSGRQLAKTGSKRFQTEVTFANNDLKEKDKELGILADKLLKLKQREATLIRTKGPGVNAEKDEEEQEAEEDELAED